MVTILFESHSTTVDNEAKLAAGWNDVPLSELGMQQAKQLGERYKGESFDAIFCSDLQRSYKTAELAFGGKYPIIKDERLRECNYGDLNGAPKAEIEAQRASRISTPFPNGESYEGTAKRMKSFLDELAKDYAQAFKLSAFKFRGSCTIHITITNSVTLICYCIIHYIAR